MNTRLIRSLGMVLVVAGLSGCASMMKDMMVQERQSPYGLEETVQQIVTRAKEKGWKVPDEPKKLDKGIKKAGGPEVLPVRLIELCHPQYAGKLLQADNTRYVSVMMPCTISVYEKSDGKTYVANMKARKVGGMLGGTIAEVFGGSVANDQDYFLEFLPQ